MDTLHEKTECDNIIYSIDSVTNTAGVFGAKFDYFTNIIPKSIIKNTKEYDVISILENAFKNSRARSVQFPDDSKIQKIEKFAFLQSFVKSIKIPSSVTIIDDGAFLTDYGQIENPSNHYEKFRGFIIIENLSYLSIPSSPLDKKDYFSFYFNLEQIYIPSDSKLQKIGKYAFAKTRIERITIPSSVTFIGDGAFYDCDRLEQIEIANDSKLQTIGTDAFSLTPIKCFTIPSTVTFIGDGAFYYCYKLERIDIANDLNIQTIGKYAFAETFIKNITIPSSVKIIKKCAFHNCPLENIEISDDSKLQKIGKYALSSTLIKSIKIPSELVELKEGWCCGTGDLTEISVSPKNPRYFCYENKMIIGKTRIEQSNYDCLVFCVRNIQQIKIPNFFEHICSYSSASCNQLKRVEISSDSKLQTIGEYALADTKIESIRIPSSVTFIGDGAFCYCYHLERISISNDSKIQAINKGTFYSSAIKRFRIPSFVTSIGNSAFYLCKQLEVIEIADDSKLQTIGKSTFYFSAIKSFRIPSSVKSIGNGAFYGCKQLLIIEIDNLEKISMTFKLVFQGCENALFMIPVHS